MMTKKSKEAAVELEPVEVAEEGIMNKLIELGYEEVPFAAPRAIPTGRRPYNHDPKHEPVVEIAGKQFEMKDVDVKDIPVHLGGVIPFWHGCDNIFENQRTRHKGSAGQWGFSQKLSPKELKFKHLKVDGLDIYISTGSTLIISDTIFHDDYYGDSPFMGIDSKLGKPILVIIASNVNSKSLTYAGNNILLNSNIESNNGITLIDSQVRHSSIQGTNQYLTVDDSNVDGCRLYASNYINISDSTIYGAGITGLGSITLTRVMGGNDFLISLYGEGSKSIELLANNQYLYGFDFNSGFTPTFKDYTPVVDFPTHYGSNVITIDRRIDYGILSAVKPVPFTRLNQCDLMVGGEVFSVKDFFPEYVIDKEPAKPAVAFGEYRSPMPVFGTFGNVYSRDSSLWQRAAAVAFGKKKAVIGKSGETIVNGLLDQIKSRIGLYVELSSVE